jgi:hypothetical protein
MIAAIQIAKGTLEVMDTIPNIPLDLLRDLEQRFPHQCPTINMSEREIWWRSGQRSVIDFLIEHANRQEEK